jgi:MFS family permease
MTTASNSWRDLFSAGGLAIAIFVGGTTVQALEAFIGTAMMPTIVRDIGGIELFAWTTTLFIVSSIIATLFAGSRPAGIGPRGAYVIAAAAFGLGSLVCGLAPNMPVLLIGRAIQGFGGGLLVAMSLAMLRLIFPQHLWPRAMALNSVVWGVATLTGPAIGGVFAELDIWRWAFLGIVPLAALLALGAIRILPAQAPRETMAVPFLQIGLVSAVVLAVSIASIVDNAMLAGLILAGAIIGIIALGFIERRASARLLPEGTFSLASPFAPLYATILLLGVSITSDVFAPLFLQRLHGLSPLWAGYVAALVAGGWVVAALYSSGLGRDAVQRAITLAPIIMTSATLLMIVSLGIANIDGAWLPLLGAGIALFALGVGIGIAFQHLSTAVLATGSAAENDRISASLGMVQLFASGLGAAIGGVVVNAAGLPAATDASGVAHAARWLFIVFTVICLLAIPFALTVSRRRSGGVPQAAE